MSSIIKGQRIRNESMINLEERIQKKIIQEISTNPTLTEPMINTDEIYKKADREAEQIVNEAIKQANQMIEEAKEEKEKLRKKIEEEQQYILDEARIKAKQILENATLEREEVLQQAYEEKEKLLEQAEPELLQMLTLLLNHIVGEEVFDNTDWLRSVVKKMMARENIIEDITIVVSTKTYEALTEQVKQQFNLGKSKCSFEEDSTLNESTCIVETKRGNIVYDVKEGLDKVLTEIKILQKL